MNDSYERKDVACADVKHELLKRIVGRIEVQIGLGEDVLGELVVITLHFPIGDIKRFRVGPQL